VMTSEAEGPWRELTPVGEIEVMMTDPGAFPLWGLPRARPMRPDGDPQNQVPDEMEAAWAASPPADPSDEGEEEANGTPRPSSPGEPGRDDQPRRSREEHG
jgi:hypothetical protein